MQALLRDCFLNEGAQLPVLIELQKMMAAYSAGWRDSVVSNIANSSIAFNFQHTFTSFANVPMFNKVTVCGPQFAENILAARQNFLANSLVHEHCEVA